MYKEDYEKYYQKGGSYVIPVEIFNELFDDYECFKNDCQKYKEIIDKAIEYIKEKARNNCWIDQYESCDLIKILKEVE